MFVSAAGSGVRRLSVSSLFALLGLTLYGGRAAPQGAHLIGSLFTSQLIPISEEKLLLLLLFCPNQEISWLTAQTDRSQSEPRRPTVWHGAEEPQRRADHRR